MLNLEFAGDDFGDEVVFAAYGRGGHAAKEGELADVSEGVGDGALEEAFGRAGQGR